MKKGRRHIYIGVAVVIIIAVIVAVVVPISLKHSDDDDNDEPNDNNDEPIVAIAGTAEAIVRHDCYPEANGNKSLVKTTECAARGCVYDAMVTPPCFNMTMKTPFKLKMDNSKGAADRMEGILTSAGPGKNMVNKWILSVEYINDDLMRFSINSYKKDRYTVPVKLNLNKKAISDPKYEVHIVEGEAFDFKIVRKRTGTVIWQLDQRANGLILTDQLLQIATRLPSHNMYGLGEHLHKSFRHNTAGTWPSFSRDQFPSEADEGNLYGTHPFYTCVEDDQGNTYGLLLLNSNAQEYSYTLDPALTYRTIGGILDFYVFMGPSPEQVIQQYTEVIGRPMMPAYWALGFQLCKYGYMNIDNLVAAVNSTRHYDIPQDVQYVDIDHMLENKDFTIDHQRFPGLNNYFKELQADGMRIIYLLDPCLVVDEDYEPYGVMTQADGAIKWPNDVTVPDNVTDDNGALLGYVWPSAPVIFPDFFKQSARDAWKKLIQNHRQNLTFDGLWIDMNEPASFGTNEEKPFNWPEDKKPYWSLHCPTNKLDDPPYRPKAARRWDIGTRAGRLSDKTICLNAVQGEHGEYRHYDVHSLYGWSQTQPTLQAARNATGERSVVITRSTFPGSGQWAGHWLGDNASIWPDLHASIIGMLDFNLFGIPYIGADICGFNGNTTEEKCLRWMQLGAFYPFSRNHNAIGSKDQGPGQLGDKVGHASAKILKIRYRLLPNLYTLFHLAHTEGSTVVRPLHHEYPADSIALSIDKQFLWGSCLLISPILEENQSTLNYYLPKGRWFSYHTYEMKENTTSGQWHSMAITLDSMPELSVRAGCILVEQESARNTQHSRKNPLDLLVALDPSGSAQGLFFWDDGVSIDTFENGKYLTADIKVQNQSLSVNMTHRVSDSPGWQALVVRNIKVLGVKDVVTRIDFQLSQQYEVEFKQDVNTNILDIQFKQGVPFEEMAKVGLSWLN